MKPEDVKHGGRYYNKKTKRTATVLNVFEGGAERSNVEYVYTKPIVGVTMDTKRRLPPKE